jgi:peptide/nickel transport system substrate-binding protein
MNNLLIGRIIFLVLALLLVLGVACGSAAQPAPADVQPADPSGNQQPTLAPVAVATPTPVPEVAAEPEKPTVHPGKVTFMVGDWETGRMSPLYLVNHNYGVIVHGFLVSTDENRKLIPGIATKWEASADGKTWTFTIRDDVLFHDGRPLTAEDVEFTWLHNYGPGAAEKTTSGTNVNMADNTEKIEQIDADKVSITTKEVDASIPFLFSDAVGSIQGVILPRWDLEKIHDDEIIGAYDRDPVAAGIMKLVRHVPQEVMEFERFDDYYEADRRVKFQTLDLRLIPEEATRVAALQGREADIAPVSLDGREQVEAGGGRLIFGPEATYLMARFRESWVPGTPVNKKEVRQALAYALDLRVFRDELFGPEVYVPKGWLHATPSSLGYSPEIDPYPYDPEKARQLLAEAGYPGGKNFPPLIIHTWVSRATPLLPESAQLAAAMWKTELGIPVEVRLGDEANFKKLWLTEGALTGEVLWRDNETRVDGGNVNRGTFGNPDYAGRAHSNPEVFELAQEGVATVDQDQRHQAYNELYRRLKEEVYEMGLGYVNIPWGVGPRIREWTPFPMSFWPSGLHTIVVE